MDYEKKYMNALKAIKRLQEANPSDEGIQNWVKDNFPELAESEDKKIVDELKGILTAAIMPKPRKREIFAWLEKQGESDEIKAKTFPIIKDGLEKQGEQKPINNTDEEIVEAVKDTSILDMIEPKFKVGDWIVDNCGYVWKIEGILNQFYILEGIEGGESRPTIEWVNKTFHLWTIQDAKDGDVLATDDGSICIFDGTAEEGKYPFAYYGLTRYGFKFYNRKLPFTHDDVHPAIKEQRDTLFAKIKEAGYNWNPEKKELKKISQEYPLTPDECINPWSEEDEKMLNGIIAEIEANRSDAPSYDIPVYERFLNWLKSLKQRMKGE